MAYWITLLHEWKLQDVQAALNVVITVTSGLAIFALTRCCWQLGARALVNKKGVQASSLLSLNTLGEVAESVLFLRLDVLSHGKIFLQCVAVIIFTLTTLFSGPIARYSTRLTQTVIHAKVNGHLAGRTDNSMSDAQVDWNLTQAALNRARFPMDQLLDYIPNNEYAWVYRPEEWNNSWAMTCESTEHTPFDLLLADNCTTFESRFGDSLRADVFPGDIDSEYFVWNYDYYYVNGTYIKDLLLFMYAANYSDYEEASDTYRRVDMAIASVHAHGVTQNETDIFDSICRVSAGPVESAAYTRLRCSLTRSVTVLAPDHVAFPDVGDISNLPGAYLSNYFRDFALQSQWDEKIAVITPAQMLRFYQAYMIGKDTQERRPIPRMMSVRVPAVQVASVFVGVFSLVLVVVAVMLVVFGLFWIRHRKVLENVPQSKLEWLLYALEAREGSPADGTPDCREKRFSLFGTAVYDAERGGLHGLPPAQQIVANPPKLTLP